MKLAYYGYRLANDGKAISIDAARAAVVRSIYQDVFAGTSPANISTSLNEAGVPPPPRFRKVRGCCTHLCRPVVRMH